LALVFKTESGHIKKSSVTQLTCYGDLLNICFILLALGEKARCKTLNSKIPRHLYLLCWRDEMPLYLLSPYVFILRPLDNASLGQAHLGQCLPCLYLLDNAPPIRSIPDWGGGGVRLGREAGGRGAYFM
jgi:hypothetical protein